MHRPIRFFLAAAVAASALLTASPAPADTFRIRARGDSPDNFRWSPDFQHITKGSRIRWKNSTTATHHVVAYGGNWSYNESIAAGESVAKRFRRRGTYKYRCDVLGHSTLSSSGTCDGMCGVVHVTR
jgi:plastocyanin